ncbi:biotin synthase BioB [Salinisphaera sp. USBA-960]|nr:biotin synthase BioB [Salifodinibacter halophilus]NNC26806.1 biotin synthase BioB [Salifodinibacter halophilus]
MTPANDIGWSFAAIADLLASPLSDLIYRAQRVHRDKFDPNSVQLSTLASIKTGACPEDCAYCPQSVRFQTHVEPEKLMPVEEVRAAAGRARAAGATRFCMGAAWRAPSDANLERVIERLEAVQAEGLETCITLGMLTARQAERLAEAGLDYYNHNLDTSPAHYERIITTRTYDDRLETLANVAEAGLKVCCGGILGMGETTNERAELIRQLATLEPQPESVPINNLIRVPGTPLADAEPIDPFDFVRVIAVARITMPGAYVRLSAGRDDMNDATQALCFLAGANSIFYGDSLLTTDNPSHRADLALLDRLGIEPETQVDARAKTNEVDAHVS